MYSVTVPRWIRWMYPGLVWNVPVEKQEKILYLTFDDGPHPVATPFVLDTLKAYDARGTFFCIGRNVADHQDIYRRILDEGHTVGNHSYDHLNGWKVKDNDYISNVLKASALIDSRLFRPPYGRIRRFQSAVLRKKIAATSGETVPQTGFTIVMWSVLSADWDVRIDGERCYQNVVMHASPGDIVVFHDSAKALPRLETALPKVLAWYREKGYRFERLDPVPLQLAAQ